MVRQRHTPGAASRETHHTSPIDYAAPSDRLYGSEMDIEGVSVLDIGAGSVTEGAIVEGGLDGSQVIKPGTLPPSPPAPLDNVPPPPPVVIDVSSATVVDLDGTSVTSMFVEVGWEEGSKPSGLDDLDEFVVEYTREKHKTGPPEVIGTDDWTQAETWLAQSADRTGALVTHIVVPEVMAAADYAVRAYSVDMLGNRQATPSNTRYWTTTGDLQAPPIVSLGGLVVLPGMNTISLRWDPILASDLAYVEVGIRTSEVPAVVDPPADLIEAGNWLTVQATGTIIVFTKLDNGVSYDLRLRSVDLSGNVVEDVSAAVPVTIKVNEAGDASWVDGGAATPTAVPADALEWSPEIIAKLFTGELNADWMTSGTLRVGNAPPLPDPPPPPSDDVALEVYDTLGHLVGSWNTDGILIRDPDEEDSSRYEMRIHDASLYILDLADAANPIAVVSMGPLGIDAASVTFGSARGGHNLVPNSSFELGRFSATDLRNQVWDVQADWDSANSPTVPPASRVTADVNIHVWSTVLTMELVT